MCPTLRTFGVSLVCRFLLQNKIDDSVNILLMGFMDFSCPIFILEPPKLKFGLQYFSRQKKVDSVLDFFFICNYSGQSQEIVPT